MDASSSFFGSSSNSYGSRSKPNTIPFAAQQVGWQGQSIGDIRIIKGNGIGGNGGLFGMM